MAKHRWGWTQSICWDCWDKRFPGRKPVTLVEGERQHLQCCDCGKGQSDGIFLREDPTTVRYPTPTDSIHGDSE